MNKASRIRWAVLLTTLAATVTAVVYPVADRATIAVSVAAQQPRRLAAASVDSLVVAATAEEADVYVNVDPFTPRGWHAPQELPPSAPVASQPVAPVDLLADKPPELPFRFVGSLTDGADQVVYLARGDQAFVVRGGDVIDGGYKVVALSRDQIEFEHISTGTKQVLVFPLRDN